MLVSIKSKPIVFETNQMVAADFHPAADGKKASLTISLTTRGIHLVGGEAEKIYQCLVKHSAPVEDIAIVYISTKDEDQDEPGDAENCFNDFKALGTGELDKANERYVVRYPVSMSNIVDQLTENWQDDVKLTFGTD